MELSRLLLSRPHLDTTSWTRRNFKLLFCEANWRSQWYGRKSAIRKPTNSMNARVKGCCMFAHQAVAIKKKMHTSMKVVATESHLWYAYSTPNRGCRFKTLSKRDWMNEHTSQEVVAKKNNEHTQRGCRHRSLNRTSEVITIPYRGYKTKADIHSPWSCS